MTTKPSIIDWHRLFGLAFEGNFIEYPFEILREKDLSVKQQFLDILMIHKQKQEGKSEPLPGPLPDGLDNLAQYNVISYKSLREPLDDWTLDELIGHYVNSRKWFADKRQAEEAAKAGGKKPPLKLPPIEEFQLYAVCTRFPQGLTSAHELTKIQAGVYEITWGTQRVRIIVLRDIPQEEHNALWNMFSNVKENIEYGATHYGPEFKGMSSILNGLYRYYNLEGIHMAYTMERFMEDFNEDYLLHELPKLLEEERWQRLSARIILPKFSVDQRLEGLSSNQRLEGLSSNQRLEGLSPDEIRDYLQQLENGS